MLTTSGWAIPTTPLEYPLKRSITIDPTVGSLKNVFHEFPEAVLRRVARIRFSTPTTSGRAIPTTPLEYPLKRSINIDLIIGTL